MAEQSYSYKRVLQVFISVLIVIIMFFLAKELIGNTDSISKLASSAGAFGPVVLILLVSLGILFTPIPSFVLTITAGYLYGIWIGALYSYAGHMLAAIGSYIAIKSFHNKKPTKRKKYNKYKELIEKNKNILYLLYAVPILPISLVSYFSVTTKISWKQFLTITFISFLAPVLVFSYFGNTLKNYNIVEILIVVLLVGILIYAVIKYVHTKLQQKKISKEI